MSPLIFFKNSIKYKPFGESPLTTGELSVRTKSPAGVFSLLSFGVIYKQTLNIEVVFDDYSACHNEQEKD